MIEELHYKYFTTAPVDSTEHDIIVKISFHLSLLLKLYKEEIKGLMQRSTNQNNTVEQRLTGPLRNFATLCQTQCRQNYAGLGGNTKVLGRGTDHQSGDEVRRMYCQYNQWRIIGRKS